MQNVLGKKGRDEYLPFFILTKFKYSAYNKEYMRHSKRRHKIGEMVIDIAKYLITVGLIGGIFTDKVSFVMGIIIICIVITISLVGFFIIPPDKED